MFGSNVLEIGIGLTFAYLSISLVCTAANELVASLTRARARDLHRGIQNLLDGSTQLPARWWQKRKPAQATDWSERFFNHHLINALSQDNEKPSYVPSQTFATVVIHLVKECEQPAATDTPLGLATFDQIRDAIEKIDNARLKQALLPLVEQARTDMTDGVAALTKFNDQVEVWFDYAMDRVSGWYKRRTQWVLFLIAVIGTFSLNVDSVAISRALATNDTLRASVVAASQKAVDSPRLAPASSQSATAAKPEFGEVVDDLNNKIADLHGIGIPIGWRWLKTDTSQVSGRPYRDDDLNVVLRNPAILWSKLCGLLLTAFAASLGAPFWFDILNKFMSVRSSGRAPEEKLKMPKAVLQPQAPNQAG